ncbi:unnamed protein product (plasmid) [Mycetohabitans rhizoxinica HKI 454]|uniref:Uncharacterized protein n=1 Tax=Mycetohabitans rhizoxinica (strain DSM 19002 / CIP 109453 / HKI 454) TaxID=882378 RepID=E5AW31_MYCRK|nr:unnamed protein product [Mycetohabitans rhizoxinica HKI 454]
MVVRHACEPWTQTARCQRCLLAKLKNNGRGLPTRTKLTNDSRTEHNAQWNTPDHRASDDGARCAASVRRAAVRAVPTGARRAQPGTDRAISRSASRNCAAAADVSH